MRSDTVKDEEGRESLIMTTMNRWDGWKNIRRLARHAREINKNAKIAQRGSDN